MVCGCVVRTRVLVDRPGVDDSFVFFIRRCCARMRGHISPPCFLFDFSRTTADINLLLLGDPSMAKSQFLKFASKVAPVGIYTSGKGSSAAGLTASVIRDAKGEFYLEGGAMVLADGGLVCIDEFDKMRPNDRVAIHEAMEQQTISVAKAGITTVLNARAAVLAAANPVYGRYDDFKSASENIDLMTTILSRFDMIFLVRDIREEERDRMICQHVMGVHMGASSNRDTTASSAISELTYVAAYLWRLCNLSSAGNLTQSLFFLLLQFDGSLGRSHCREHYQGCFDGPG
jgi:DNA replicative helicase MCM subunit Mcm2 (Cdc46/Mcm family)